MLLDSDSLSLRSARLLEEASSELSRLDALLQIAPPAFGEALRLGAVATLGRQRAIDTQLDTDSVTGRALRDGEAGERSARVAGSLVALVAARTESRFDDALAPGLRAARQFVDEEESRVRDGGALTSARLLARRIALWDAGAVDAAARAGHTPRPALLRALGADAAIVEPAAASAVAGLLLCGAGVIERLWLLPFVGVSPGDRAESLEALAVGDPEPWRVAALTELARAARERQRTVGEAFAALPSGERSLDPLGRAAITARSALAFLHTEFAATVPSLSARLELSRPAAGDALERLAELGLVTEITGRGRDRVFALASAYALAEL